MVALGAADAGVAGGARVAGVTGGTGGGDCSSEGTYWPLSTVGNYSGSD